MLILNAENASVWSMTSLSFSLSQKLKSALSIFSQKEKEKNPANCQISWRSFRRIMRRCQKLLSMRSMCSMIQKQHLKFFILFQTLARLPRVHRQLCGSKFARENLPFVIQSSRLAACCKTNKLARNALTIVLEQLSSQTILEQTDLWQCQNECACSNRTSSEKETHTGCSLGERTEKSEN